MRRTTFNRSLSPAFMADFISSVIWPFMDIDAATLPDLVKALALGFVARYAL
jgi:hypothetical protein